MQPFGRSEYERRLDRTKERMRAEGIETLFLTDPANMNYLSGYDGWSFYVHQGLVVSLDHDQPVWVGREPATSDRVDPSKRLVRRTVSSIVWSTPAAVPVRSARRRCTAGTASTSVPTTA